MGTDMIFCVNPDCPFTKGCQMNVSMLKDRTQFFKFANLGARCPKYVRHVADRNEKEKARVMKQCR